MNREPCGCNHWVEEVDGQRILAYEPCSITCPKYVEMLDVAAELGKPVTVSDYTGGNPR